MVLLSVPDLAFGSCGRHYYAEMATANAQATEGMGSNPRRTGGRLSVFETAQVAYPCRCRLTGSRIARGGGKLAVATAFGAEEH